MPNSVDSVIFENSENVQEKPNDNIIQKTLMHQIISQYKAKRKIRITREKLFSRSLFHIGVEH